ncbi:non-hydrolyzing UDP-N-acetylglucosamine 2-epimerase [Enterococcus sp. C76]|uniref:non-hydrolyzing UDP-N-acetylglucosamine 2-epimerase n=1 Tax=Enterococcus sp. C76 TaxID=3231334 RepID=UPI0034A08EC4
MNKIKVLTVVGTRPEAIKMAPVIKQLEKDKRFSSILVLTAQHRQMLDEVLNLFQIEPNYDLDLMTKKQDLAGLTSDILENLTPILKKEYPDIVLVHGDTTTAFASALAAFYLRIKIGHVESGLRSGNKFSPFPEEVNRKFVDMISDYYFAPTLTSKINLVNENCDEKNIFVTGNTIIDSLMHTVQNNYYHPVLNNLKQNEKIVLLTMHRRENLGDPMHQVFKAIKKIASEHMNFKFLFPVHSNPIVKEIAIMEFNGVSNVHLVEPMNVIDFHNIMARCDFVLTDSGGIQEEASYFGIPVFVLRDTTERIEGLESGCLRLIGTKEEVVYREIKKYINNSLKFEISKRKIYGDGKASQKILEILAKQLSSSDNIKQ